MKMAIRTTLLVFTMFLLTACGGPTIDGKNEATYEASLGKIVTELPQDEAIQLMRDMETISKNVIEDIGGMTVANIQKMTGLMLKKLDGKSATDIHKMAEKIRAD